MYSQPWFLEIDADERLDEELESALPVLIRAPEEIVHWKIARRPFLIGYGYTPKSARERKDLRLVRNGRSKFDSNLVHEGIVPDGPVKLSPRGSLLHFRPLLLDKQILKENKDSTLKADCIGDVNQRFCVLTSIVFISASKVVSLS